MFLATKSDIISETESEQSWRGGLKEADSAACGKEDVKLGQQPLLGILPAEWKKGTELLLLTWRRAIQFLHGPGVFFSFFFSKLENHGHRNAGGTARLLCFCTRFCKSPKVRLSLRGSRQWDLYNLTAGKLRSWTASATDREQTQKKKKKKRLKKDRLRVNLRLRTVSQPSWNITQCIFQPKGVDACKI